jgi:hypothetical protein
MAIWRNKVDIKRYFDEDETDEKVLKVVNLLIKQLKVIKEKEEGLFQIGKTKGTIINEDFLEEFQLIIDNFEFIRDAIQNNEGSETYEYENWCEVFNDYLTELYDIGDELVRENENYFKREKFLFVG